MKIQALECVSIVAATQEAEEKGFIEPRQA